MIEVSIKEFKNKATALIREKGVLGIYPT